MCAFHTSPGTALLDVRCLSLGQKQAGNGRRAAKLAALRSSSFRFISVLSKAKHGGDEKEEKCRSWL